MGRATPVGARRDRRVIPGCGHVCLRPGLDARDAGRAFGVAQSGLYAVQGIAILAGGAVADIVGAPTAVGLSGVAGVSAAAGLAMGWIRLRRQVIASQRPSRAIMDGDG